MTTSVYVAPLSGERWVVATDDDGAPPISEHATRGEAETAARAYAITFGIPKVMVHGKNGKEELQLMDPDPQPPTPGAAKGPPDAS
jgi:hypothetical protein